MCLQLLISLHLFAFAYRFYGVIKEEEVALSISCNQDIVERYVLGTDVLSFDVYFVGSIMDN